MSYDPGDDDDVEDRLEDLTQELSELNRLLRNAMMQEAGEGPEEAEPSGQEADLWDVGDTSPRTDSEAEYKQLRRFASNNTDIVVPSLSASSFDSNLEKIRARVRIFEDGFDNLASVAAKLGNEEFDIFMGEYAIAHLNTGVPSAGPLSEELVRLVRPSAGFWGIRQVGGEVSVTPPLSPLQFLRAYGELWSPNAAPWRALDKGPEPPDTSLTSVGMDVREVNQQLAIQAFERRSIDLPEEYAGLLPPDMQREFYEDRE